MSFIFVVSFNVVASNSDLISVIAHNLSGKWPYTKPFSLKNYSVELLYLSLFLLQRQQKVITRIIVKRDAAITVINKIAWHFSQLAQPPSLQQYKQVTVSDLQIFWS